MRKLLTLIFLLAVCTGIGYGQTITPASPVNFCVSGVLTVSGYTGSPSFQWKKNTVDIPGANASTYLVTSSGNYSVVLSGTPPVTVGPVAVTINPNPIADFTFNNNNTCSGTNVQFTSSVTSGTGPFTYTWDFGDGNTSNAQNPTHAFVSLGCATFAFTVTLTVTDSKGCTSTVTHSITVKQVPDVQLQDADLFYPFSNCQNSPTTANPNYTLQVNNISPDANTCISSYTLNWGDGSPALTGLTNASFPLTHLYTQVGAFPLTITAASSTNPGCTGVKTYIVANQTNPAGGLGTLGATTNLCVPATVPFIISSWQNNSIGTTYILNFGDGNSITLTHPLNAGGTDQTVNHIYTTSSCPVATYTATLTVVNACDSTPYTAGNIQIRIKPQAGFTVAATGCAGQSICMNNTTIVGGYGPTCSTATAYSWDFGDPGSGTNNTSTTASPCHTYSTPGTYTISLTTGNPCGTSTITRQICIAAPPTVSFTLDNNTGCSPLAVAATNTSDLANSCNVGTYAWTVSYAAGFCGANSHWSFTNGTTASSANPSFLFDSSGTYTITLAITNPCGTFTSSQSVTVKKPPIVTINGVTSSCTPTTINPTATVTNCGTSALTYLWSFPGGTPATSGNANPGAIVYNTAGSYTVTLAVTNECGTTTSTQPLSVQSVTTSNAGLTQTKCGNSITMAANTPVTGTGTWTELSGPNTATITSPNSPTTTITGLIPGTYVFTWTIDNAGCSSSSNVTINISAGPTTADAGTDIDLCQANSTTLNANTPVVGTGLWTQVSGPAAVITNPSSPVTSVTGLATGVYVFQWTISFSNCTPSTDNIQVSVFQNPSTAAAGNDQVICSSTAVMSANTPAIGTGTWTQVSGPGGFTITSPSSPTTTITGLVPGTYVFKWKITNGNCPFSDDNIQITVTDIPTTANAGPDQSLCAATTATLAGNTAVNGTGTWTQVSGPTATITNTSLENTTVTGLVPGTYVFQWTITNGICPPTSDNVQVTVSANATVANAGPDQTKCGTSIVMAANTPVTGTGAWTQLSGPNTSTITTASSPVTNVTGLIPGSYVFQWTITNGACSSQATVNITISSGPTASNAGPDQDLCLATSTTFAANNPATGTGQWTQVSGPAAVITNAALPNTTVTGLSVGTYVFRWTISFSNCTPTTDDIQVRIFDNPTTAAAGNDQDICLPNTTLAANTPTIGTGLWTQVSGPAAVITNPASPSTTVTGLVAGTYTFAWTISNGPCPASQDIVQVIYSVVSNNSITGVSAVCINTAPPLITGSIPTGSVGPYTYQWQISTNGGATWNNIAGATNPDYSPGILTVSTCYRRLVTTLLCSSGNTSNVVCITVNLDAHALFSTANTLLCAPVNLDTVITVTPFPLQNQQYNWYHDGILIPGTVNGLPPSYIITNPGQTVVIKLVTTSLFGCKADSMSITFNTRPSVTADFIKDTASGCGPLAVSFTNTSSILNSSIEFYWDFGNGITLSNVMQPPAPVIYAASPLFRDTTYYITLKVFSGCDTTIKRDSVKIFANPKARFTALAVGCSPFQDTIINNSFGQDASTVYYWDFGDGTLDTTYTTGTLYHTYITGIVNTYTIQLIMQNRCSRDTQTMNVIVSPSNIVEHIVVSGNGLYGCAPHTVDFQNSSVGASVLYWDFGDGSPLEAIPNSQSTISHAYLSGGIYNIHITLENYCSDTTVDKQVTVYDPPAASFTVLPLLICTGNSVTTNNSSVNANSFEWFWGDGNSTAGLNASHIYATGGVYNIRLVARKVNAFGIACTDTSAATAVTVVDRIPAVIDISQATTPCAPYTMTVTALGAGAAAQVDWYFYDSNTAPGIFHISGPTATYIYNQDGIDSVKLVVENAAGCKDSTVKQFTVYKKPIAVFTPVNIKTCNTDTTATFNVSVNYGGTDPVTYEWFINDLLSGNSNPFTYHFQAPSGITAVNIFSIKVLVRNSFGCGDTTLIGNFIIQTIGVRHIVVSPSVVQEQPHYTFSFTDTALVSPNFTYLWYTGDRNGQQLPGKDITYTYGDTGTYHVKLLVHDYQTGCMASDSVDVFIISVPGYLYVPNAFCPGCHKAELRQFLPLGKGLKDYHLIIFNVWGEKVFETRSLDANGVPDQPWNGNWPGSENVKQGALSWFIEAHYINGTEWKGMLNPLTNNLEKKGFITIIR